MKSPQTGERGDKGNEFDNAFAISRLNKLMKFSKWLPAKIAGELLI